MRSVLSVSIDEKLKGELDRFSKRTRSSRSSVIKRAIAYYLYIQDLNAIRLRLRPLAEAKGFFSDEDIFNAVS